MHGLTLCGLNTNAFQGCDTIGKHVKITNEVSEFMIAELLLVGGRNVGFLMARKVDVYHDLEY
ncbi:MAG: hypothetical protein JJ975_13570 [Bacteroidia bacterium]|nr:hypothetical protein [Bacteroidia bacterium]